MRLKFTVGGIIECFFFLNHSLKVKQKAKFGYMKMKLIMQTGRAEETKDSAAEASGREWSSTGQDVGVAQSARRHARSCHVPYHDWWGQTVRIQSLYTYTIYFTSSKSKCK